MRISEITSSNKPYIRITKGRKRVDIPIIPKVLLLPPNRNKFRDYSFVGCESVRIKFKGKTVKLNWTLNHNRMTLYCSSGRRAYSWKNVKVTTITDLNGKKEHMIICKKAYGDETERRRFVRFPIKKEIVVSQGDRHYKASTVDISYGGIGILLSQKADIVPSELITVDFGMGGKPVRARMVRAVFNDDGSKLLGCFVSKFFRYEMMKIVNHEMPHDETKPKDPLAGADAGWRETTIKRWH